MDLDGPEPVLLTTQQTADMLGISRRSVATLCRDGTIRAVRLGDGGRWRVLRNSVDEIIRGVPVQKDWALPQRELQASSPRATEAA
jgi:excisionase family DNA binding protein